jgi:hypothetical protein
MQFPKASGPDVHSNIRGPVGVSLPMRWPSPFIINFGLVGCSRDDESQLSISATTFKFRLTS